uniref:Uncharacterized protein n=1 Tax=Anguilla anguilla TaxID=7936 RepID=A0A0E9UWD0_ANGAN
MFPSWFNNGKSSRSRCSKASPHHHTTPTMFDSWYDILTVKCFICFTPDIMGPVSSKKLYF